MRDALVAEPDETRDSFPVSVLLERRTASVGRWSQTQWDVLAVVVGEEVASAAPGRTAVRRDEDRDQHLYSGLRVRLYKDGCESYWYNLQSDKPYLFVVCYRDEGGGDEPGLTPVLVTANQDEANAHMEADDAVYSVPMPEQAVDWVERFVVTHYVPEVKRKRRRKDWVEDSQYGSGPRPPPRDEP